MSAYGRTVLAVFSLGIIAGAVEALAFVTHAFVPITYVFVDGANSVGLVALLPGVLCGHFWPPRMPPASVHPLTEGYLPLTAAIAPTIVLVLVGLASAVAFTVFLPASAFLAGYVAGALFFLSGDRRKGAIMRSKWD